MMQFFLNICYQTSKGTACRRRVLNLNSEREETFVQIMFSAALKIYANKNEYNDTVQNDFLAKQIQQTFSGPKQNRNDKRAE